MVIGKSNYNNVRKIYDGIHWDSLLEIKIYKKLKAYEADGLIQAVIGQPSIIEITPSQKITLSGTGKSYQLQSLTYSPDMSFQSLSGETFYIDTKCAKSITEEFKMKVKLLLYYKQIYIHVITDASFKGFPTIKKIIEGDYWSILSPAQDKRNVYETVKMTYKIDNEGYYSYAPEY